MEKKSVLICGAGSIGIYLGAKLHHKNHSVKLFGRRKLRGINDTVIIENKTFEVPPKSFNLKKNESYDSIFITSKIYDMDEIIRIIKKNNITSEIFAGIQNGIIDTSKYTRILGRKITPIVVFSGFNLKGNEIRVMPTPTGWKTENTEEGKKISSLLISAGIPCNPAKRFNSLRAEKTIVNCCLNGLSAIENRQFCELFRDEKTRERINNLFEESYNILKKAHPLGDFYNMRKKMFKHWSKLKHYSSTCQDINSGRKNEIEFFNGYLAKLGKKYNLPTEQNQAIVNEINSINRGKGR